MSDGCVYRVVLRARNNGTWQVLFYNGRQKLFTIPYRKQGAAEFMAAKIVDDLMWNKLDFFCNVQDENGQDIQLDLVRVARKRKVKGA